MKKIFNKIMLLSAVAVLGFFYSCNSDEETFAFPVISFSGDVANGGSVAAGEEFELTVTVVAEGKFNVLRVTSGADTEEFPRTSSAVTVNADQTEASITLTLSGDAVGTYELEFEAVDDENQVATATYTFSTTSPLARSYSAVLLSVPLGDLTGKNFYATSTGTKYSSDDVTSTAASISPSIDFGYYYGNSNLASIASPKGFESTVFASQVTGWGTKNATKLRSTTLSAAQFAETTTFAAIDAAFTAGTAEADVKTSLSAGNVIAFERADGKRGLILVKTITGTFNQGDSITIDVLVQEPKN